MGEGLYRSRQGRTAYVDLFEDIAPEDWFGTHLRYDDFAGDIRALLSSSWWSVHDEWRDRTGRVIARNNLHEIWLTEDSYSRVHVTFGVRKGLDALETLAWHWLDLRAAAFFDMLQAVHPLRVRTSPWTSAARETRRIVA